MERYLTIKFDLEYPEEAKFAIDAAAKTSVFLNTMKEP